MSGYTQSGRKDIGIRKLEFVTKTHVRRFGFPNKKKTRFSNKNYDSNSDVSWGLTMMKHSPQTLIIFY